MAVRGVSGSLPGSRPHKTSTPLLLISAPATESATTAPGFLENSACPINSCISRSSQGRSSVVSPHSIASSCPTSARSSLRSKRPPASRCSNGVETAYGPPPASITRAPWRSEKDWSRSNSPDQSVQPQPTRLKPLRPTTNSYTTTPNSSFAQDRNGKRSITARRGASAHSRLEVCDRMLSEVPNSPHSLQDVDDVYYDAEQVSEHDPKKESENVSDEASIIHRRIKSGPGRQEDIMQTSNEDLFLNLAQDTTPQQTGLRTSSRSDHRQVCTSSTGIAL